MTPHKTVLVRKSCTDVLWAVPADAAAADGTAWLRQERDQGCNSIDILNFGHKTGPSSGPTSVLGHYKFRDVSKLQT